MILGERAFVDYRMGGIPQCYLSVPEDAQMRVPDFMKDCVVYLGEERHDAISSEVFEVYLGTAFFVKVPSERFPGKWFVYLVTARHLVDNLTGRQILRLNTKDGKAASCYLAQGCKWYSHPDSSRYVDVALTPASPPEGSQARCIPIKAFLTDEVIAKKWIGAGDEVFIMGLFNRMKGKSKNIPIVRMGNVALLPDDDEPIPDVSGPDGTPVDMTAYLIEGRSIGGLSGSPIWVRGSGSIMIPDEDDPKKKVEVRVHGDEFFLMGLIHGHWGIHPKDVNDPQIPIPNRDFRKEAVNLGIAIVVRAKDILATINQPELIAMRKKQEDAYKEKSGSTTPDLVSDEDEGLSKEGFERALKKASRKLPPESSESSQSDEGKKGT